MKGAASARPPGAPRRLQAAALKFAFAFSLAALAFAAAWTSSREAFSDYDLRNVLALGAAFHVAAPAGALFALRGNNAANAALTLIVLAGVVSAYVVHTDLWLAGNRALLVLLCAMAGAGLFVALRVIDEVRWGGAALTAAALIGIGAVAGKDLALADRSPAPGDVSNIRDVSFLRTPNLYFISFESLIPRSLLRKHLGVESSRFHDRFDAGLRRFPNFFADAVPTKHSLQMVLALEPEVYHSQRSMLRKKGRHSNPYLFSGLNPSPLLGILRRNGYETTSIYVDGYFGKRKGPWIDRYVRFVENTVCGKLEPRVRDWAFWGYCRIDTKHHWNNRENRWGDVQREATVEEILKASARDGPQFVMAHLLDPGHTWGSFRHDDASTRERFRKRYLKNLARANGYLRRIVRHLERSDPGAILLVYGDHGPFVSQGVEFEDDPRFVVRDHYGVLGGVWPRDACAPWLDEASAKGWMTVLDAVHALLRCLSGGEGALVAPRQGPSPRYGKIPPGFDLDYGEFLYE